MSLSKREKTLLIIVVLLALIGLYYMLYLKPCLDDIRETSTEIEALQMQQSALDLQNAQNEDLLTQIDTMDAQLALYGDEVTHTFDQPAVLVYLSDTVNQYAAKNTISFAHTAQTGVVERYSIDITFVTTYDGLKQLLAALDESPYLLRISQMTAAVYEASVVTTPEGEAGEADTGNTDTSGETDAQNNTVIGSVDLPLIAVELQLDFYCLSNPLPEDGDYSFDTPHQYGGDIFY